MKKIGVIVILAGILVAIAGVFWYQEMQYLMPTPVPEGYTVVHAKEIIPYDTALFPQQHNKPKLLHFFSPDCPCSRFNLKHFHALAKTYGSEVDFYVVVDDTTKVARAKELVSQNITIVVDQDKKLAGVCGVYSTPQAAIIQASNRLYFKGNYNRSRYCTNKESNFVQMALDSLCANKMPPIFNALATTAYGCSIPSTRITLNP